MQISRRSDLTTFVKLAQTYGPFAARELHLDGHGFGEAGLMALLPLLSTLPLLLPNLEKLALSCNSIGEGGLTALLDALCPASADGAAAVDVSDAQAEEAKAAEAKAAEADGSGSPEKAGAQTRLKSLDLTHNEIGDAGFERLQAFITSERLVVSESLSVHEGNRASG